MKKYFYKLLASYLAIFIRPTDRMVEIDPANDLLYRQFTGGRYFHRNHAPATQADYHDLTTGERPEFIVANGNLHYERNIIDYLNEIHDYCGEETRLVITYYSTLWRPLANLATSLGLRDKLPEVNWLTHEDIENLLRLTSFEAVRREGKVLLPLRVPLLSTLANRYLAPLPFFRNFNLVNILVARPLFAPTAASRPQPSVSVIIPARNESGNIEKILERMPRISARDQLIFIEGGSTDNTWETIQKVAAEHGDSREIIIARQDGRGKGDAVRKGFDLADGDILMILDADLTVQPEILPQFYAALTSGQGEFINGSRLVYPMEKEAMRFFNILGNKFFALAFSFVLGQRFKDTLCGTKAITRRNYQKLARTRSFFGNFDPFGDFDLIFGAARLCLKIIEVPVAYQERTYGATNISRWRHGTLLARMLFFAARKIKFT